MNKEPRFVLGLTGSIAMGKTTVSNMFRDLGTPVWCADNEVNRLYKKNGAATKEIEIQFPSVVIETGIDKSGKIAIEWGVYGVPETFLINKKGEIIYRHAGPLLYSIFKDEVLPFLESSKND